MSLLTSSHGRQREVGGDYTGGWEIICVRRHCSVKSPPTWDFSCPTHNSHHEYGLRLGDGKVEICVNISTEIFDICLDCSRMLKLEFVLVIVF